MVHAAVGFARTRNRLQALACTASIGPGSTNMLTGAALATTNRIPVLLLPQRHLRHPGRAARCCRSWSSPTATTCRSTTRSGRCRGSSTGCGGPEQLPAALLGAMRVLTDPAETGAVTIALPQDVQAEAFDWPEELFAKRVWHIARPVPEPAALARAVEVLRSRPAAADRRRRWGASTARPPTRCARSPRPPASRSPTPRPARARCCGTTRRPSAGSGPPARRVANALAREADVVIGIGTRYSDFTTASQAPRSRTRTSGSSTSTSRRSTPPSTAAVPLVADAREGLEALRERASTATASTTYVRASATPRPSGTGSSTRPSTSTTSRCPAQTEVLGALNEQIGPDATSSCRPPAVHAGRPADALARAATPSSTTSSTPTPAWATRSRARSASRWPRRIGRCTPWSATAPT